LPLRDGLISAISLGSIHTCHRRRRPLPQFRSWTETVAREHCQDTGAQSECSAMRIQRYAALIRVQLKAHICAQFKEAVYRVKRLMVIWGLLETVSFATNIFFISS
jgi:hypothetical protein